MASHLGDTEKGFTFSESQGFKEFIADIVLLTYTRYWEQ
jgi:hypothetical protein